jgi:hypothetical protein
MTRTSFMARIATCAVSLVLAGGWAAPAGADEAKAPISAALLLNVLAPAAESQDAAFDRAMKEPSPGPRSGFPEGQVQPDGSVRYGSTVITVRNPCPPGTVHYEPPPLPGRFRK